MSDKAITEGVWSLTDNDIILRGQGKDERELGCGKVRSASFHLTDVQLGGCTKGGQINTYGKQIAAYC